MPELALPLDRLLRSGATRLEQAGLPEPMPEALRLWSGLQGSTPARVFLARNEAVDPRPAACFRAAVTRRAQGEPLAYVTGWAGFRHLTLKTDGRALIPRPETEGLVELVLDRTSSGMVADIGAGTGCIALSLAKEGRYTRVVAMEQSTAALALARENRVLTGLSVDLLAGDLCDPLADDSLDALVSNPPYIAHKEYLNLDPSVRGWEPAAALESGVDGLDATRRLLEEGRRVVRAGGWIALEVDSTRAERVARMAGEEGWARVTLHADVFGRTRYLLAQRSKSA